MIKVFFVSCLLTVGVSELKFCQVKAQAIWEPIDAPIARPPSAVIWKTNNSYLKKPNKPPAKWEVVPELKDRNQLPSMVIWEVLETEDDESAPLSKTAPSTVDIPPSSLEEAEALLDTIPLKPSDYQPVLRLSHLVSTAETLALEQWRVAFGIISPFASDTVVGNQNYSVNLDIGFHERLQLSLFMSQADDAHNAPINRFGKQHSNFWKSYGAAARWQVGNQNNLKIAVSGSLERWDVGSGGVGSFTDARDDVSPNIFNDSGSQVFTRNIVGSLSLPVSWQATDQWQFSFNPGVSFLPATQGEGQGGAGTFYGNNTYVSGGVLFQPFPELGLTASIAQPIGSGTNTFDADLEFSRVPIYSAGINWDLNPRISLQGIVTNGFGTTPATSLLTMPSDNRLGYSASFVFTPDTADTPQNQLTPRQRRLAKGGLTVNTALVPPDTATEAWINTDSGENFNGFVGYSLSNVFQLTLLSGGLYNNVPQSTPQARLNAPDGAWNWRIGGKAVAFSPLRGAPFWGGGRIALGKSDQNRSSSQDYAFAESMATWEATNEFAINVNPKVALSEAGHLWGLGISSNLELFPDWELVIEGNIVINELSQSNGTVGVRWHATESMAIEAYGSTAASLLDIGQLINAEQVRWGGRILLSL